MTERPYREASVVASRSISKIFSSTTRKRASLSLDPWKRFGFDLDPQSHFKEGFLPRPQGRHSELSLTRKFDGFGYFYTYSNHDSEVLHIQRTKINNSKFLASFIESESVRYNLIEGDRLRIFDVKGPKYSPIMDRKFATNEHSHFTNAGYHAWKVGIDISRGELNLSSQLTRLNLVPWLSVEVEYIYIFDVLRSVQKLTEYYGKNIPIQRVPSIPDPTDLLDISSDKYYLPYLGLDGPDPSMIVVRCDAFCTLSRAYDLWLSRASSDDAAFVSTERGALLTEEKQKGQEKERLSHAYRFQRSYKELGEWGWVLNGCLNGSMCDKCWRSIESEI